MSKFRVEEASLTPPKIATRLHVSAEKVIGWLLAGELKGSNLAAKTGGRPRYRVSESDLANFLERRSASPAAKAPRRRRQSSAVTDFY
jgi:transposase